MMALKPKYRTLPYRSEYHAYWFKGLCKTISLINQKFNEFGCNTMFTKYDMNPNGKKLRLRDCVASIFYEW